MDILIYDLMEVYRRKFKYKEYCYNLTSQTIIKLTVGNHILTIINESEKQVAYYS